MPDLIAIDPGDSAGVAVFSGTYLLYAFTSSPPHRGLKHLLRTYPGAIACEQAPKVHSHQPETTSRVERIVAHEGVEVYYIKPSQWKGHPWSRFVLGDRAACTNRHERDAVSLGRWFLNARSHGETATPVSGFIRVR